MSTDRITPEDFATNRKMSDKRVLRYVENFASYLHHITTYFQEELNQNEQRWCVFLIQRIDKFIQDCPPAYEKIAARYKRCQTRINKILNSQSNEFTSVKPTAN